MQVDVALEANLVVELTGLLHTVTSTISPLSRTVRSLLQVLSLLASLARAYKY